MIAHLGMYDMPPVQSANDRFWQAIRSHLGYGPVARSHTDDFWSVWTSPDLLLSQTCGYPYRARLHGQVTLIGTPDYGLPGCAPGYYNSVLVVNAGRPATTTQDLAGQRFAYNEPLSQSGWAAPMTHLAGHVQFSAFVQTGSHAATARAVADGRADIGALDAVTWALLSRHTDLGAQIRVLEHTRPTPGLPYITALGRDPAPIASAIGAAIAELPQADRALLHLRGLVRITAQDYLAIPTPPAPEDTPRA